MNASRTSHYADAQTARRAVALVLPAMEAARLDARVCGSGFFCIVVLDPALDPEHTSLDDAVLLEHALGDRQRWDADYAAFARAKAALAWRERTDSAQVQQRLPHRLRASDSLLAGAVWLDGIVVAVSGAYPEFDEAFALAIAAQLRALAAVQRSLEALDGACHVGSLKASEAA